MSFSKKCEWNKENSMTCQLKSPCYLQIEIINKEYILEILKEKQNKKFYDKWISYLNDLQTIKATVLLEVAIKNNI